MIAMKFALLTLFLAVVARADAPPAIEPTEAYEARTMHGFPLLLHPELKKHPKELKAALAEMDKQLTAIVKVLPKKPLARLKKVKIWMEWEKKKDGAAEFHPSVAWLKANGYNPDKAGCVEINNARNFVRWSELDQPWMVLHELAHAYHFLVLGDNHRGIEAAFKQAVERKLYESVEFVRGGKRKAYALTNSKEYFAELSEAYFGRNDFYPFTRAELEKHDPVGFRVLRDAWEGKPAPSQ